MPKTWSVRRLARNRSGSVAIEFAVIAPVLLIALVGILMYGLYFGTASSVQQLAADAARASVAGLSDAERATIARQHVAATAGSYVLIDGTRAQVTARPSTSNPNIFEVAVTYDATSLALWSLNGLLPLPSPTIVRSAAIQRGGY